MRFFKEVLSFGWSSFLRVTNMLHSTCSMKLQKCDTKAATLFLFDAPSFSREKA